MEKKRGNRQLFGNLFSFLHEELVAVDGRSKRSWVHLTGRTIAAWLGSRYFANVQPDVPENAALYELLGLIANAALSLFVAVLMIELFKVGFHLVGREIRMVIGRDLFLRTQRSSDVKNALEKALSTNTVLLKVVAGDGTVAGLEEAARLGVVSELPSSEPSRVFLVNPDMLEWLKAHPVDRERLAEKSSVG